MADFSQLSRLTRKADSVAESASVLVRRTLREIRGELANLSGELNLAGNAGDREKVYAEIRRRMALLSRRMNALMEAQNEEAAKGANAYVNGMLKNSGIEVKYSPSRAKAICELVTPAQGENLAAVFTDRMGRALINSLREATVGMLREQAIAGGSMKDMSRDLAERWSKAANMEDPKFTDAGGHVWNTKTYIQMNVRTNTMRVYNDCVADDIAKSGSDIAQIVGVGDQDCDCAAWEGCIISLTGKTEGLPTYEDARNGGCFHPNCTHSLTYIPERYYKDEIELQKSVPADENMADDYDAQDERKYQIDQARYMRDNPGMTQEQARVAVDRDNLAASIQSGLIREDAREIVAKMTDAQVTALCPDGNPPAFEPVKRIPGGTRAEPKYEREKWNRGSKGGVVHIARDTSAEHILSVARVIADRLKKGVKTTPPWYPSTPLEVATNTLMNEIGAVHTTDDIPLSTINPDYQLSRDASGHLDTPQRGNARATLRNRGLRNDAFTYNCQRCVPTWEAVKRGYRVTAKPYDASASGPDLSFSINSSSMWKDETPTPMIGRNMRARIEAQMAQWGDGARCEVRVAWKGAQGNGHVFVAEQVNGQTVFYDPQSNTVNYNPFDRISTRGRYRNSHWILRTDNNEFTDVAKRCFIAQGMV